MSSNDLSPAAVERLREARLHPSDYARGYIRGIHRAEHGDLYGTEAEHALWLTMADDPGRAALGHGYRDGLAGAGPLWRREIASPDDLRALIDCAGGQAVVARVLGAAARSVRRWYADSRSPGAPAIERLRGLAFDAAP